MKRFSIRTLCVAFAMAGGTSLAQDVTSDKTTTATESGPVAPLVLPGGDENNAPVKPLAEGPLHEAFLSPAKNEDPDHVAKTPPQPIVERPGVDSPDPKAQWIEGYWDWDPSRNDFTWVTGTWRVPPPGRFWVNGYWKRDDDGWFRVPGFWSDRQTDRIDYRKDGPPKEHPADDPGPSPGEDFFYVPGQYVPDANGVAWKKGFWAKGQPGWAWVPAQWVKQPEGYVFQEGYWDRVLEDRGTLFSPAAVTRNGAGGGPLSYAPISQIAPQSYGRLYGALGRPTTYYDGYPGCYYDANGLYYGYANYGNIGLYTGYLDYPYIGGIGGYPYLTTGGYGGFGYGGYGYGGLSPFGSVARLLFGYGGYGFPYLGYYAYPYLTGFGYGYNYPFGGFGLGYPFGGYGLGGFGFGYPFGYGGYGYGGFGYGGFGFGYPFFLGGLGFGGFGHNRGGGQHNNYRHHHPFYPGNQNNGQHPGHHSGMNGGSGWVNNGNRHAGTHSLAGANGGMQHTGPLAGGAGQHHAVHHVNVQPAARSAFGNPLVNTQHAGNTHAAGPLAHHGAGSYNGGHTAHIQHVAARPAFNNASAGVTNALHSQSLGINAANGTNHLGPQQHHAGQLGGANQLGLQHHAGQPGGANQLGLQHHTGQLGGVNQHGLQHHAGQLGGVNQLGLQQHHAGAAGLNAGIGGLQHHQAGALGSGLGGVQHHVGGMGLSGLQPSPFHQSPSVLNHAGAMNQFGGMNHNIGAIGGGMGGFNGAHHPGIGAVAPMHHMGGGAALGSGFGGAGHMGSFSQMGGGIGHVGGMSPGHMGGGIGHVGGMGAGHMGGFGGGHMGGGFGGGHMGGGFGGGGIGHVGGGGHMGGHH